jgi:hypothetical protein
MARLDMTVVAENVYKFLLKYIFLVFVIITLNLTNLQHGGMPELCVPATLTRNVKSLNYKIDNMQMPLLLPHMRRLNGVWDVCHIVLQLLILYRVTNLNLSLCL